MVWEYLLKLMIAIPVLGISFWAFIKWTQQSTLFTPKDTNLSIKECLRVSPKATLQVVQVGDQYLLISVTEQHVNVLKEMTEAESVHWSTSDLIHSDQVNKVSGRPNSLINQKGSKIDFQTLKEWKVKCLNELNKK